MYIMTFRKYANSKFATVISFAGMIIRYVGVFLLIEEKEFSPTALICIAVGIGLHFLAELISKKKTCKAATNIPNVTGKESTVIQEQPDSTYRYIPPRDTAREVINIHGTSTDKKAQT